MAIDIQSTSHKTAMLGIFAALHFVITIMPYSVALGTTGSNISMGIISAPIIGLLLGPYLGALAVLIGAFLGVTVNTSVAVMGPLTPFATATGALAAGLLTSRREKQVIPIMVIGMIAYILSPIGLMSLPFLWLHVIALSSLMILVLPKVLTKYRAALDDPSDFTRHTCAITILAFIATMTNHIIGSSIAAFYFVYVFESDPISMAGIFLVIAVVYPIERLGATAIITVVSVAILRSIQRSDIFVSSDEKQDAHGPRFRSLELTD